MFARQVYDCEWCCDVKQASFPFSALHVYLPIRQFFYDIIHPEYSPVCDVYALMFLVDVVNFIIIIFGYWAFGVSVTSALSIPQSFSHILALTIKTNYVPWCHSSCVKYMKISILVVTEAQCGGWYNRVIVWGSGSWSVPRHVTDSVQHHDRGPRSLSEENSPWEVRFPGGAGFWDPLLDVLHTAWCHRKVRSFRIPLLGKFTWVCSLLLSPIRYPGLGKVSVMFTTVCSQLKLWKWYITQHCATNDITQA